MPKKRFQNRRLEFFDIIHRFEAVSAETHLRSARGAIERLRDEGRERWEEESKQLCRWCDYCDVLWKFFMTEIGRRRFVQKQDVETAFREFVSEFEHSIHGMFEMLYGTSEDPVNDEYIQNILSLIETVYRLSTYAIISYWIGEKHEENLTTIKMKIDVSDEKNPQIETRTTTTHTPMPNPSNKHHRRGMKRL